MRIWSGQAFTLDSAGNGAFYTLANLRTGQDLFFQGDDALAFEADRDAAEATFPNMCTDDILALLWSQYT